MILIELALVGQVISSKNCIAPTEATIDTADVLAVGALREPVFDARRVAAMATALAKEKPLAEFDAVVLGVPIVM